MLFGWTARSSCHGFMHTLKYSNSEATAMMPDVSILHFSTHIFTLVNVDGFNVTPVRGRRVGLGWWSVRF